MAGVDAAVWVAIAGVAVAAAGAGVTAYAASEQAAAQEDAAKFNEKTAENQALAARYAAQVEAENRREQYRRAKASQTARIGGSGVVGTEGSPLLVQLDAAEQAELDLQRVKYAGETGARSYESEAVIQGFTGRTARRQGQIRAGTSLLQGVGNVAQVYGQYNRTSATVDNGAY